MPCSSSTMAGGGFEEFSVPPGSELALPPLFGGNILESELETEVEFVDGGLSGDNLQEEEEEESQQRPRSSRMLSLQMASHRALSQDCYSHVEVNERVLNRLHHVQKITRRLKQERKFLMRVLDSYGDDYRQSQLTFVLEDEGSPSTEAPTPGNIENEPPEKETSRRFPGPPPAGPEPKSPSQVETPVGKKRRRPPMGLKWVGDRISRPMGLMRLKSEDEFPCDQDTILGPSWPPPRDKLLHYPKFSSPGPC
uniref:TCF3 fusion partner n=1 Tax=Pelodiscus sinensis TaxID=13735 RepID=K7F6C1_PELSI